MTVMGTGGREREMGAERMVEIWEMEGEKAMGMWREGGTKESDDREICPQRRGGGGGDYSGSHGRVGDAGQGIAISTAVGPRACTGEHNLYFPKYCCKTIVTRYCSRRIVHRCAQTAPCPAPTDGALFCISTICFPRKVDPFLPYSSHRNVPARVPSEDIEVPTST